MNQGPPMGVNPGGPNMRPSNGPPMGMNQGPPPMGAQDPFGPPKNGPPMGGPGPNGGPYADFYQQGNQGMMGPGPMGPNGGPPNFNMNNGPRPGFNGPLWA